MKKKLNKFIFENDYVVGVCEDDTKFLFDIEDYNRISKHVWKKNKNGFIVTIINGKTTLLSRFILNLNKNNKKVLLRNKFDYRRDSLFYGNRYKLCGNYYEVECFDKSIFQIDSKDYDLVNKYTWHVLHGYVISKINGRTIKLHRFLLSPKSNEEIDHKDRNPLNNCRNNLRIVSRSENYINRGLASNNTSGYIGVYKINGYDRYAAQINCDGKRIYLGSFDTLDEAVNERRKAEEKYHKHILS